MQATLNNNEITITGEINQDTNFESIITQVPNPCVLNLKGVEKINSTGVKHWINFWEKKSSGGVKLIFKDCSIAIVEQLNMVKSFSCKGTIESFQAPFICNKCENEWTQTFTTSQAKGAFPKLICPSCKSNDTEVDEIEEEYLAFNT